jgi:hypothetical protein
VKDVFSPFAREKFPATTNVLMRFYKDLPTVATVGKAYQLLWRYRGLHAKAIWPPLVFLVLAEFLYHRIVGNAHGLSEKWHAMLAASWYMPTSAAVAWLIGLKFLRPSASPGGAICF